MLTPKLIPLSLYIHIPWCIRKCPYCDFNSHTKPSTDLPEEAYLHALTQDLEDDCILIEQRSLQSIFIGGGTPSLCSGNMIQRLLKHVSQRIPCADPIEITLEANPGTLEQHRFREFYEAGVNRLSLGIQSFQDDKLRALGRIHNAKQATRAIESAQRAGFHNINCDLMYGLPKQTVADALYDLQQAINFHPPHISWYQLTLEPNTVFL